MRAGSTGRRASLSGEAFGFRACSFRRLPDTSTCIPSRLLNRRSSSRCLFARLVCHLTCAFRDGVEAGTGRRGRRLRAILNLAGEVTDGK
jgi:hypothetical protein